MALDRLLAMTVFVKVVEQGSFAKAADRLNMSNSAVSRHVAELEAHLDLHAAHHGDDVEGAARSVAQASQLAGFGSILAPVFGSSHATWAGMPKSLAGWEACATRWHKLLQARRWSAVLSSPR